jgi:hypothetical protein
MCGLALAGIVAFSTLPASNAAAGTEHCPDGGNKIDVGGPMSFTCGEGGVITGICVKAGTKTYGVGDGAAEGGSEGCYEFSALGGSTGSVSGGGTGRDCKAISYSSFYCDEGEPPSEPVCGNEVVEEGEQCDPPGRISEALVCNDACQLVEAPGPDPVCGNGVVEAGEQCDPPGPITEAFRCSEACQILAN